MKIHLTDSAIARLKTPDDRVEYKDTRIPGFTLRVGRRAKVWYFRSTVRSKRVTIKLGTWPVVPAEMARARCIHWLQQNRDTYAIAASGPSLPHQPEATTSPTLQEVYQQYTKAKQLKPTTLATYSKTLRLYLSEYAGKPLLALTSQQVRKLYAGLKSNISVAKANAAVTLLKAIWRWWGATQEVELPDVFTALTASGEKKRTKAKDDVLLDSQIRQLGDGLAKVSEHKRLFALTGLYTGLRLSELLKLTPSCIDFKNRLLSLQDTKNGKPHTLPISQELESILQRLCAGKGPTTALFPAQIRNWCSVIAQKTGITFTAHTLRRTFASQAAKLGLNAYQIKALLNHHAGADVTQLHYIRFTADDLATPIQRINTHITELLYTKEINQQNQSKISIGSF
ncbi:site-specific integrase [Vogesella sp. LIG4]|uniref:site-specific integrase n=1 Tax=Vogesella sp. LIG4 TaxID=1192162 RepID=UPI00081FEB62|nr:site-specific integrase [Vogesella sp. LIG4]SCK20650.1 Site-specific recombinase XerD [Vogesella sp. LIG4]